MNEHELRIRLDNSSVVVQSSYYDSSNAHDTWVASISDGKRVWIRTTPGEPDSGEFSTKFLANLLSRNTGLFAINFT